MKNRSRQHKAMPNGMIQIAIPHEERNARRIRHAARYHEINRLRRQSLPQILHANEAAPTHPQVHGQTELGLVFPKRQHGVDANAAQAACPDVGQQHSRKHWFVMQGYRKEGGVATCNENVYCTHVENLEDVLGSFQFEEGVEEGGA